MPLPVLFGFFFSAFAIVTGALGVASGESVFGITSGVFGVLSAITVLQTFGRSPSKSGQVRNAEPDKSEEAEATVVDPVTSLPDSRYFEVAFDSRVAAARRHLWPVSVVLIEIGFAEGSSTSANDKSLKQFGELVRKTLREADIACRLSETVFGLILEDTSEEGGVWTAERLQIALSHDKSTICKLVAGVAAYPTHGLFPQDVIKRARTALRRAISSPPGRGYGHVEVAHADTSH